jgi:hypothetical protein
LSGERGMGRVVVFCEQAGVVRGGVGGEDEDCEHGVKRHIGRHCGGMKCCFSELQAGQEASALRRPAKC